MGEKKPKYYNPEKKQNFIDRIDKFGDSLVTLQGRYKKLFTRTMEEETELDKDLSDFQTRELLDLYAYLGIGKPHVLRQTHFDIMSYIREENVENWRTIDLQIADVMQHCSYVKFKNSILSMAQLYKLLEYAREDLYFNPIKVIIIFAMFEGIGAKDGMEFYNLSKDDLENRNGFYYAHLCTGRELEISEELYNLCLECCSITRYAVRSGLSDKPVYFDYEPSNHVFKKKLANTTVETTENNLYIVTSMAIKKACNALKIPRTTTKKIFASGFYEYIKAKRPELLTGIRIEGENAEFVREIGERYNMTYRVTHYLIKDYADVFS